MKININGVPGRLEAIYNKSEKQNAPCVLLLHSNTSYENLSHNSSVMIMEDVFLKNDFSVLRFNLDNIDKSDPNYNPGVEEIIVASSCCDWIQAHEPTSSAFWVSGISFGAYIAIQIMMRRIEINHFAVASIPANRYDMSFIYPCPTDGLFIHAEKDSIAPIKDADKVIKKSMRTNDQNIEYQTLKHGDHFFNCGKEEFRKTLANYVKEQMTKLSSPNLI